MANNPYVNKVQLADGSTLIDISDTTAVASDVASGKYFYNAAGQKIQGTSSGGGTISIVDTADSHGGDVRTITAINTISGTKSITANGTGIDVASYALVDVAVPATADYPTFTMTIDATTMAALSATCDKTYAECAAYYDTFDYYAHVIMTAEGQPITFTLVGSAYTDQSTGTISYYVECNKKGVADYQIDYASNGTITVTNTPIPLNDSTDLTASTLTVTAPSGYYESNATKTLTDANLVAGNIKNGVEIFGVTGSYEGSGTSKNTQVVQNTTRINASTLTAIGSALTVSKTGTYDIYWSAVRTNTSTSYTWGTQLYKNDTAYGSENTTWTNNVQSNHVTNVSLTSGDKLQVYGRETRGTSYYVTAPMIAIVEQ